MWRKTLLCILATAMLMVLVAPLVQAQNGDQEQKEEQPPWWKDITDSKFIYAVIFMFTVSSIVWLIDLFRKDRILKMLLGKYLVILTSGEPRRITGKFRLEKGGIEIFSEESRLRGQAPSYIFEQKEMGVFEAFIRYHDAMTEREKAERDQDFENTYHPKLMKRMGRALRNFSHEMKDQFKKTFEFVWGKFRQSTFMRPVTQLERQASQTFEGAGSVEEIKAKTFEYAMDVQYDRLIDRLVGTKVLVEAPGGRYTAVLKEYTTNYMYLMDLRDKDNNGYKEEWQLSMELGKGEARDDRNAIRARLEGDVLILESYAPYEVQVGWLKYEGDPGEQSHDLKWRRIDPFGEMRIPLRPSPRRHNIAGVTDAGKIFLEQRLTWRNFKKVHVGLRSFRAADVVFPRSKCKIKERAEKYQPTVLDLGGFTEAILNDIKKPEEMVVADKEGNPIRGVHLIHGYVTNINEDRIDIKEVDAAYSKRWSVEHMFETLDQKLRKVAPVHLDILPPVRQRMLAQTVLAEEVSPKPQLREPIAPPLYMPMWGNGRLRKKGKPILPIKVLVLTGNVTRVEFPVLESISRVREHRIIYHPISDLRLPTIEKSHILWIGYGEIFSNGYRLTIDTENRIRNFVHKGGIVIISGQDMSNNKRPTTRWVPELISGVERDESHTFDPTFAGRKLFDTPHKIEVDQPVFDDAWTDWGPQFEVLATINGGQDAAVLRLEYGRGIYLLTSLRNATPEDVKANAAMMENLLYHAIEWYDDQKREHLYIGAVA